MATTKELLKDFKKPGVSFTKKTVSHKPTKTVTKTKNQAGEEEVKLWDYLTRKLEGLDDDNFTAKQIWNRVTNSFKPKK